MFVKHHVEGRDLRTRIGIAWLRDPPVAAAIADSDDRVRRLLGSLIARARAEREVPEHVDPEITAWALFALAQGIAAQLLYQPEEEATVSGRLDATIAALLC